jgi:hypothetical protein
MDSSSAESIEILPGANKLIDWTVPSRQSLRIHAQVTDSGLGKPPGNVRRITVRPRELFKKDDRLRIRSSHPSYAGEASEDQIHYDPASGLLEISDLPGATYEIRVDAYDVNEETGITGERTAVAVVRLTDNDVAGVRLDFADTAPAAAAPIRARVKTTDRKPSNVAELRLVLRPNVDVDREFEVELEKGFTIPVLRDPADSKGVIHSEAYRVLFKGLPDGWYVREAKLNGADVLSTPAPFLPDGELEITLSPGAGSVQGIVKDASGRPAPDVPVTLIPDRMRDRGELYATTKTDQDGRFTFSHVEPGAYSIFAWEALETNAYFDPEVMRRFDGKGSPARVTESSTLTVDVTLIPAGAER